MKDFASRKLEPLARALPRVPALVVPEPTPPDPANPKALPVQGAEVQRQALPRLEPQSTSLKHRVSGGQYPHTISIRLDEGLYVAVQNTIQAFQVGGDYHYQSVSDVIREALTSYFNGMQLSASLPPVLLQKRRTSFLLDDELKERYQKLPSRKRSEITERAIRTFLQQRLLSKTTP